MVDQRIDVHSVKPKSKRWTLTAFSYILDTARVNAQTIFSKNKGRPVSSVDSTDFMFDLALQLIKPWIH